MTTLTTQDLALLKDTLRTMLMTIHGLTELGMVYESKSAMDLLWAIRDRIEHDFQDNDAVSAFDDEFMADGWEGKGFRW